MDKAEFDGRVVVVTGGTGALGAVVVGELLKAGASCRVPVFNRAEGEAFVFKDQVQLIVDCDLTNEADVARLYDKALGHIWASIHIAGGFEMSALVDTDKAALMRQIDTNLVSCYLCCAAAARSFGSDGGRIVNVSARAGLEPRMHPGSSAYAVSKAGVAALTQVLGKELGPRNILVNAVAPSIIDTPANRAAMHNADYASWPRPVDIAATIVSLASPSNKITSGAVLPTYGTA